MKLSAKKLRILFVDDEDLELPKTLTREGYDVDQWHDADNLDRLCDGTYQVVFLDVRGIGAKNGGNGLDVLRYVATHNPMIYVAIFSAKPFTGTEAETIRRYARRSITKDCTLYDLIEILEEYTRDIDKNVVLKRLGETVRLGFFEKRQLKAGKPFTPEQIEKISRRSAIAADAVKIVSNTTTIAVTLVKLLSLAA